MFDATARQPQRTMAGINQLGAGEQLSLARRAQAPDNGAAAELTIGQQVGQNLYLKIQQSIGDQSQTNFILEYQLTDWLRLQTNVLQGSSPQQLFQRMQGSGVNLLFFFSY